MSMTVGVNGSGRYNPANHLIDGVPLLTKEQCAAARAMLGLKQADVGKLSSLSESTIRNFEKGRSSPSDEALGRIASALEKAGAEFIAENGGGAGVRLAKRGAAIKAKAKTTTKPRGRSK